MKDKIDVLIEKSFEVDYNPDKELNKRILECAKRRQGNGRLWRLPKVAVAVIAVICMGSVVVYAASSIIREVFITEHSVSVGNPDYVDDEAIAAPEEPVTTESVLHEEGNESVNWISKDVEVVNGYATNTYYAYKDYETALQDSGLDNWFNTVYENEEAVTYVVTETEDFVERCINAGFVYGGGSFFLSEGIMTGNLAEDLTRSVQLANTNNKRDYTSVSGQVFTLVDEITEDGIGKRVRTYVMIAYGDYDGYICFENLKNEEIYKILDTLEFSKH